MVLTAFNDLRTVVRWSWAAPGVASIRPNSAAMASRKADSRSSRSASTADVSVPGLPCLLDPFAKVHHLHQKRLVEILLGPGRSVRRTVRASTLPGGPNL